jgi:hypothetical protein
MKAWLVDKNWNFTEIEITDKEHSDLFYNYKNDEQSS